MSLVRRPVRVEVILQLATASAASDDVPSVARTVRPGGPASGARTFVALDDAWCQNLERIASAGLRAGPVGAWQRRALLRSLRRAEPTDGMTLELLPLGRNATAQARACLVRTHPTAAAFAALRALVDDGARIVSVTSVSRLLARVYGVHPVPRLFVARTAADERHVLVVDAVPCFARTVASDGGASHGAAAVAQSLEHLAGRYAAGRIDIAGIGLDDATLEACRALDHVGDVRHVSRADLETTLRARLESGARAFRPRYRTAHVPALMEAVGGTRVESAWRRRAVPAAAALSTGLAALAVGHALATRSELERVAPMRTAERARLEAELALERATLQRLHARPFDAAASLARAEWLDAGGPPGVESVLTLVAMALRGDDALRIDSIGWAMASPHEGDTVFADAASLPARALEAVSELRSNPDSDIDVDIDGEPEVGGALVVELAGRVVGASDVGAAERTVDRFAATLAESEGVDVPVRLDSPLERAAAGSFVPGAAGRDATRGGGPNDASGWRLRFTLAGREIER